MPQNKPDFELEFERAIASYADPDDAGHSQILVARVQVAIDAQRRKPHWRLGISVVVTAMACLLLLVLLPLPRHRQTLHQVVEIASTTKPLHSDASVTKAPPADRPQLQKVTRAAVRMRPRSLPKLDHFPDSALLTEQEQLLLQFVARTPQSTQQAVAKTQKQFNEPLQIARLVISPLEKQTVEQ